MNLRFGNPHFKDMDLLKNSPLVPVWESAGIFQPLLNMPYPCEITSQKEIHYLIQLQGTVDPARKAHCELIEDYHFEMWDEYLRSLGLTPSGPLYEIVQIYDPIIDYLKLHYSRPRPAQFAHAYNLPLYPLAQRGPTDSCYPGGHTLWSLFVYHHYVQVAPHLHKPLMAMVLDVAKSREELGLHYPSDSLFSFQVYQHIKPYMTKTPLHVPTQTTTAITRIAVGGAV